MRNIFILSLTVLVLAGTSLRAADDDKVQANDLKQIVLGYHNHHDATAKGPTKAEDLAPYLENDKRLLGFLKSGAIVFQYGVTLTDMKQGTSKTILAYEKGAPDKGGLVAFGDGVVKKLTAEEFKKAPLATKK